MTGLLDRRTLQRRLKLDRNSLLEIGARVLGRDRAIRLATQVLNVEKGCHPQRLLALANGFRPGVQESSGSDFLARLFALYYDGGDAESVLPGPEVGCARSFAAYRRGFTNALIFNFFRQNYGIRDPILLRASIFESDRIVWSQQHILAADAVLWVEDPALNTPAPALPAAGTLLVEVFHPRIRTISDQFRFFAIYRDGKGGRLSGVHSMALPKEATRRRQAPLFGSVGPSGVRGSYQAALTELVPMQTGGGSDAMSTWDGSSGIYPSGLYSVDEPDGFPAGIWHEQFSSYRLTPAAIPTRGGACVTTFYVPDFAANAPVILVMADQVGFLPERITFRAYDGQGALRGEATAIPGRDRTGIDLAQLFAGQNLTGGHSFVADLHRENGEFAKPPVAYLHIYYRANGTLSDEINSMSTVGYWNDPQRKPRSYRCRKFAPLLKDPELECLFTIINVGGMGVNRDDSVKIRIFTDTGEESLLQMPVATNGTTVISGDDLLGRLGPAVHRAAVVQFEHETTNYQGNWFVVDRRSRSLAVDHLTGG